MPTFSTPYFREKAPIVWQTIANISNPVASAMKRPMIEITNGNTMPMSTMPSQKTQATWPRTSSFTDNSAVVEW